MRRLHTFDVGQNAQLALAKAFLRAMQLLAHHVTNTCSLLAAECHLPSATRSFGF